MTFDWLYTSLSAQKTIGQKQSPQKQFYKDLCSLILFEVTYNPINKLDPVLLH